MLVNTHNPESCAFRSEEHAEVIVGGAARLAEVCTVRGATLQGIWVNRAAHKFFALIDAPTAHAIDDVIVECGWVGHTDSEVVAVTTMEEARASAERQQAAR
jgi:hypothetical protein